MSRRQKHQQNETADFFAVPVILYNDKREICLIAQDNAPLWRVFGNAFGITGNRRDNNDFWHSHAQAILARETNLPVKYREKARVLFGFSLVNGNDPKTVEANRVFAIDIGKFPLQSKKGAYIEFFPIGQRPENINPIHGIVFDKAAKLLAHPVERPKYFVFNMQGRLDALDGMIRTGREIAGLQKWRDHPAVVAKRAAGTLSRDPG